MSITAPDDRISTYTPVVATTEFPALFPIFDNTDLAVFHEGVERFDFTVSATYVDGISNNARAVFASGITGNVTVVGVRSPRRGNRFGSGPLPVRDMNLAFDALQAESQEARRDIDRAIKVPVGRTGASLTADQGEFLIMGPDGSIIGADPPDGAGNMNTATYDPRTVGGDAFDPAYHVTSIYGAGRARSQRSRARDVCHLDDFNVDPTGVADSTAGIMAWLDEGQSRGVPLIIGPGNYRCSQEIAITRHGQIVQGAGMGYGTNTNWKSEFKPNSRIIFTGTGAKYVKTRRKPRASVADPNDDPISSAFNVQADGVLLKGFSIWCNFDPTTQTVAAPGDNWDVGLFTGCVLGFRIEDVFIGGPFRKAGWYYDVTGVRRQVAPKFTNPRTGVVFPESSAGNNSDECTAIGVVCRGARQGLSYRGALRVGNVLGNNYYDGVTGGLITDTRGNTGARGFLALGCRFYAGYEVSGQLTQTPSGNAFTESEDSPCAVYLDGHGNYPDAPTAAWGGNLTGVKFAGGRQQGNGEGFTFRSRYMSQIIFEDTVMDTAGMYGTHSCSAETFDLATRGTRVSTTMPTYFAPASWQHVAPMQSVVDGNNISILEALIIAGKNGKRAMSATADGFEARGDGLVNIMRSAGVPLQVGNNNGSGPLINAYRNGSLIGHIGVTSVGLELWMTETVVWCLRSGGSPEGVVTGGIGSLCMRLDNGTLYRKTSGTGNTGWVTP